VLLVEDERTIARFIQRVVGDAVSLRHAADGNLGIELLLREDYDVVLCDLSLPGVHGTDVYAAALELRPELARHFVFLTGWPSTHLAPLRLDPRVPLLTKPFTLAALETALARAA